MIRNILWEMDGTLFDTYPAITFAFSKSLNEMGLSVPLNVIDGLARQSLDMCVGSLSQRYKVDADAMRRLFKEHYRAIPSENKPLFPRVRQVCAFIRAQDGRNVVVTERCVESTQRLLDWHKLATLFAGILSVEQGYPPKPDPAMLEAALQLYGLDQATTLIIGNREIDIRAGRTAGIQTCLFGKAILSEKAHYWIDDFGQLLDILAARMAEEQRVGDEGG